MKNENYISQIALSHIIINHFGSKGLVSEKEITYFVNTNEIDLVLKVFKEENNIETIINEEKVCFNLISTIIYNKEKVDKIIISSMCAKYLSKLAENLDVSEFGSFNNNKNKPTLSLDFYLKDVYCGDDLDFFLRNLSYSVDIILTYDNYENDDYLSGRDKEESIVIGNVEILGSNVNILDMNDNDMEILDSNSGFDSSAYFSIINYEKAVIKEKVIPKKIIEQFLFCDNLSLIHIQNIAIHKSYRGMGLINEVFNALKVVFSNHLFLLKPFPLQHSNGSYISNKNYSLPNSEVEIGIRKLVNLYSKVGFQTLKIKSTEPYMVMLNN